MVGRVAVCDGWAADASGYTIPLSYRVEADGMTVSEGSFDGWILGRGEVEAAIIPFCRKTARAASEKFIAAEQALGYN